MELEIENDGYREEIARLREALRPMTKGTFYITHEDIERAREILKGEQ